jgi:hypothetical protein
MQAEKQCQDSIAKWRNVILWLYHRRLKIPRRGAFVWIRIRSLAQLFPLKTAFLSEAAQTANGAYAH